MESERTNFTIINHKARLALDLSLSEYCIADTIFCLSANPANKLGGWCYASKETLGRFLGLSKQSTHTIINSLIHLGLVEKNEETKYLKTTRYWYESVVILKDSKETLPIVKKLDSHSKETLLAQPSLYEQNSKETLPNILDNNKDNNFEKFFSSYPGKRKDRKVSQRSWKKIDPKEHELIFSALAEYRASEEWQAKGGQFIPYTSKWLNQEKWKDEPPPPAPKKPFYKGDKMQQFDGKWKVFDSQRGEWLIYGGKLSEIEWK